MRVKRKDRKREGVNPTRKTKREIPVMLKIKEYFFPKVFFARKVKIPVKKLKCIPLKARM